MQMNSDIDYQTLANQNTGSSNTFIARDNCTMTLENVSINQRTNISSKSLQNALVTTNDQKKLESSIKSAMEQTTQNLSLNVTSQRSKQIIKAATELATNLRQNIVNQNSASNYLSNDFLCDGDAEATFKNLSINQSYDLIQTVVQDSVSKTASVQDLSQSLAADAKQTVQNGLLGVILALALVMVLFFGGPAILGLVVAGKTTGLIFNTLSKTPETKMLLVALIFGMVLLYVSADCGGSFPVFRLALPPRFILNLIPGVKIKPLVTLSIVPSFCRGAEDKDGKRPLLKTRMYIAYGVVCTLFAVAMLRLIRAPAPQIQP